MWHEICAPKWFCFWTMDDGWWDDDNGLCPCSAFFLTVKSSRTVLFQLWKWCLWHFLLQNHLDVPKITKKRCFLLVSKRDIHFQWNNIIHAISRRIEGENSEAAVSKVHHLAIQRKGEVTNTHTQTAKIRSDQHIQISNFRFKSREKLTRGSERCEKDHTAITNSCMD
jgi:hypothetical protein